MRDTDAKRPTSVCLKQYFLPTLDNKMWYYSIPSFSQTAKKICHDTTTPWDEIQPFGWQILEHWQWWYGSLSSFSKHFTWFSSQSHWNLVPCWIMNRRFQQVMEAVQWICFMLWCTTSPFIKSFLNDTCWRKALDSKQRVMPSVEEQFYDCSQRMTRKRGTALVSWYCGIVTTWLFV